MKKKLSFLIITILLLLISSCSAPEFDPNGELDGIPFEYYTDLSSGVSIYKPLDYEKSMVVYYDISQESSTKDIWTVNSVVSTEWLCESDIDINSFKSKINPLINDIKINIPLDIKLYDEGTINLEVTSNEIGEKEYIIASFYMPFMIREYSDTYYVYVPIYFDIYFKYNNLVEHYYTKELIHFNSMNYNFQLIESN